MADRSAHNHRRKTAFAPIRAVGCMSGTSLDGVDAAELSTDGERIFEFGATAYRPYNDAERNILRAALGHWPGTPEAAAAAILVEGAHAEVLSKMDVPEVIGFHGQTLAHEPQGRGTFQAGDGAALAKRMHRRVVWDFRSADIAMGGQGAPLAPAYHFALAHYIKAETPQMFLNLGGVGNLTWVDPSKPTPDTDGALLAFDTGPANAPLNDLMQQRRGLAFDQDGALAAVGKISDPVVTRLLEQPYFLRIPPKSLDRNDFAWLLEAVAGLGDADAAATLTAAAVMSVVQGIQHLPQRPERVLVTGGGRKNTVMMSMLATALALPVVPVEEAGLDGDMLEAQAFGFLAVRVMRGLPTSFPSTTGVAASVGGGEVSHVD